MNSELSKPTSIFGLRLWIVIGIFAGVCIVLILFLLSLCFTRRRRPPPRPVSKNPKINLTPVVSKEIQEISNPNAMQEVQVDMGKLEHRVVFTSPQASGESKGTSIGETVSLNGSGGAGPEVSHVGWGRWYTLRELEMATNGLADENVIGEGGYGIVYKGVLVDGTCVAVKNLLNNRYW